MLNLLPKLLLYLPYGILSAEMPDLPAAVFFFWETATPPTPPPPLPSHHSSAIITTFFFSFSYFFCLTRQMPSMEGRDRETQAVIDALQEVYREKLKPIEELSMLGKVSKPL